MKYKLDKIIFSERNLLFDVKNVFFDIDKSPLLRKQIEDVRNLLKKKYNIKSLQINASNKEETHLISSLENKLWHEFLWTSALMGSKISSFFHELNKTFIPKAGEGLVDYAGVVDPSGIRISYYLLGIRLEGYRFMFNNAITNNRTHFVVAFENINLNDLKYEVYKSLVEDLQKLEGMLNVFLDYFKTYGVIDDSIILQNMLSKDTKFSSLIF